MQQTLASRHINFLWNTDKYVERIPILHQITELMKTANVHDEANYNTLLSDEYNTMNILIEMLRPDYDYDNRIILCNKALVQKGDLRSLVQFLDTIGIQVILYNRDMYNLEIHLVVNDTDIGDPGYFRDTVKKLAYELLFYGSIKIITISITLAFNVTVNSKVNYNLFMTNNITEVEYES